MRLCVILIWLKLGSLKQARKKGTLEGKLHDPWSCLKRHFPLTNENIYNSLCALPPTHLPPIPRGVGGQLKKNRHSNFLPPSSGIVSGLCVSLSGLQLGSLWLSWKKRPLPPCSQIMASHLQAAPVLSRDCRIGWRQNIVQGFWTSGLASLSESPQILHCSRVLNCPGSWQKASEVQPETIMSQDCGYGPVVRAALCQRTDVCLQTLRKVG